MSLRLEPGWGVALIPLLELSPHIVKPYKINDQLFNQEIELKYGSSTRRFPMDKISNGPFTPVRVHVIVLYAYGAREQFTDRVRPVGPHV